MMSLVTLRWVGPSSSSRTFCQDVLHIFDLQISIFLQQSQLQSQLQKQQYRLHAASNDVRQDQWRKTRNIVLDPLARKASGELEVLLDEAGVKRMADEGKLVSFLVGLNDGGYHHSTLFLPGLRCVSVVKTAPVNMHVNSVC